ncbi:MAG: 2-oxoacid:acceptor oxidoreductase family protein [Gammaproteobacteria bacterium]|nr:2-oxoacid:acceptor oxidoreductase family protein [Gammaproteobacteria bacterium]MDH3856984.1 2-oxoacid:acceptor oxidoreductase family protein [Gammaproteobacteria bacterium]
MFRIRFHGRGGQGMKTASRILGTAFFSAGYEVQDAPRYGAERRGAPIFAYVRAAKTTINERGIIGHPDLVIVADDTLVGMPAAGVTQGMDRHTVLLINTRESVETWQQRLNTDARILILTAQEEVEDRAALPYIGSRCAAAAAALTNAVPCKILLAAIAEELGHLNQDVIDQNLDIAGRVFDEMTCHAGLVEQSGLPSAKDFVKPDWIDFPFENAEISNLAIHAGATSVQVRTGLWRTMRPVINYPKCNGCAWICSTYCPDGAINVRTDGYPEIDYDHCKGCLVCVAQCPPHAIESIAEHVAREQENGATT